MSAIIDPPPSLEAVRRLEERALRAWPALESMPCRGWVVRYSHGYTKRANSANAVSPSSGFAIVRPLVEIFYRSHRQPVIFRLSPLAGAEADARLEDAGYRLVDPTLVMIGRVARTEADPYVRVASSPARFWADGFAAASGLCGEDSLAHEAILAKIEGPCGFAALMEDDQPLGYGLAVADHGLIGLFDIVVAPGARRRGIGRRIASALMSWGCSQGAQGAYIQVAASNSAAIALYLDLGFREAYRYHYRVKA